MTRMFDEETLKRIASVASRNVAGSAFNHAIDTMQNIPRVVSISEQIGAIFSSSGSINDLAKEIADWEKSAPENTHLVIMLRTPNNDMMDVEKIRPNGWQFFVAEGYIQGMPAKVAGHIATLSLYVTFEETRKGTGRAGFTIETKPLNEPQPIPEPQSEGNT